MKNFFLIFSLLFLCTPLSFAQDITVESEVNIQQVVLDSFIRFSITVTGTQNAVPINLPEIEGFQSRYLGPARRTSIVNGTYLSSITFSYSLFPLKTGAFKIPSIDMEVDGKTYTTDSIDVEVMNSQVTSSSSSITPSQQASAKINERVFLSVKLPKTDIYLHEKLPVKILLFVAGVDVQDIQYPQLKSAGIIVGEYEKPLQYNQVIHGIRYEIIEFNTTLYPTRMGKLLLDSTTLECNMVVRSSRQGRRGSSFGGGFLNDDFFSSFFDSYEKRPLSVNADPVVLNVSPLPKKGRPQAFNGAVGKYQFDVSVSPKEVKVGDPITLRMTISGKGNLGAVQFPLLGHKDRFKTYDPIIKAEGEKKILEQVIIPKSADIKEIPVMSFSYFDPDLKKYRTLSKGPFSVSVEKGEYLEPLRVVGIHTQENITAEVVPESLGRDIIFIKDDIGGIRLIGERFYRSGLFIIFVLFLLGGFVGVYVMYQKTHRLETDIVYARKMRAPKQARKSLAEVKKYIQEKNAGYFYNGLFKTLQQYLGNKYHLSSGSITYDVIVLCLTEKKHQKVLETIKGIMDECDAVRYASAIIDQKKMIQSYHHLEKIIDYLERT